MLIILLFHSLQLRRQKSTEGGNVDGIDWKWKKSTTLTEQKRGCFLVIFFEIEVVVMSVSAVRRDVNSDEEDRVRFDIEYEVRIMSR